MTEKQGLLVHASCVVLHDQGVLITGKSGSGKSGLALQLLALGASLIADDQVQLARAGEDLKATCPAAIRGIIEARQFGLLQENSTKTTNLHLVVDLDTVPGSRLPDIKTTSLEGIKLPLIAGKDVPNLSQALYVFTRSGASLS